MNLRANLQPLERRRSTAACPPSDARELKQLRDGNAKLKGVVADLSLQKVMPQDVVQKKS